MGLSTSGSVHRFINTLLISFIIFALPESWVKGNKVAVAPKQSSPWFRKKAVQPNFIVILLENVYFFIYAVN